MLTNPPPDIEKGTLTVCQFYELGDEIRLAQVSDCLANPTVRRQMFVRLRRAESIQIAEPPVQVELGMRSLSLLELSFTGILRASIYDLGVVALLLELPLPSPISWKTIASLMSVLPDPPDDLLEVFLRAIEELEKLLAPAISQPQRVALVEDYNLLLVESLTESVKVADLGEHPLVWAALLGETAPLSPSAAGLVSQMSYYTNDLALMSWNGALLFEPEPLAAATALALIEFANVELLLMRSYDTALDAELVRMYRQLPQQQPRFSLPLVHRYSRLLHEVQRLVAEFTEVTERVDNALKVTDDVYWNRFYSAIVKILRLGVWRSGVEHKLALLRETYSMLHDQADTERATALEWAIVLLIVVEIVMAWLGH